VTTVGMYTTYFLHYVSGMVPTIPRYLCTYGTAVVGTLACFTVSIYTGRYPVPIHIGSVYTGYYCIVEVLWNGNVTFLSGSGSADPYD
jgi:hypothetical protein